MRTGSTALIGSGKLSRMDHALERSANLVVTVVDEYLACEVLVTSTVAPLRTFQAEGIHRVSRKTILAVEAVRIPLVASTLP